jgi:hypothetical protein
MIVRATWTDSLGASHFRQWRLAGKYKPTTALTRCRERSGHLVPPGAVWSVRYERAK